MSDMFNYSDEQLREIFHSGMISSELADRNREDIKANYQLALVEQSQGKSRLTAKPSRAKMSLTALCNVRCVFCGVCRKIPEKKADNTLFPSDKVIDQWLRIIPSLKSLELFREGESFLNKDFFKFARFARNMGVQCITNSTNAMALTKEIADQVLALPLDGLKFSIQGTDEQSVGKMMPGGSWERIKHNIGYLCQMIRHRAGRGPSLTWSMVLCAWNIDQLIPALKLAIEWKFRSFVVHYIGIWGEEISHLALKDKTLLAAEKIIQECKTIAENEDIHFIHPKLGIDAISDYKTDKSTEYVRDNCFWPWQNLELDASGAVMPCCGGQKVLGNLNDSGIDEIWNSRHLASIRKGLSSGRPDSKCRKCHYGFKE